MSANKDVYAEFMTITPEMAKGYLQNNRENNRAVKESAVAEYLRQMNRGKWCQFNGETIKFDREGIMYDGQHRLIALIRYGSPLKFLVAFNCDPDAFSSIDTGRNRRGGDMLSMLGEKECNTAASALGMLSRYQARKMEQNICPSNDEIIELYENNVTIAESVKLAIKNRTPKGYVSPSMVAFIHYVGKQNQGLEKADRFVMSLCKGEYCANDQPIRVMRQRLLENLTAKKKLSRNDLLALLIKTWNAFACGKELTANKLRFRSCGDSQEQFPVIA